MANGLLLCPTPVHMNLSRFYSLELLTTWLVVKQELNESMQVCIYLFIYIFIYVSIDVSVQWIKWSVQDRIGISRHFSQQKLSTGVSSLVPELFVSGGFP